MGQTSSVPAENVDLKRNIIIHGDDWCAGFSILSKLIDNVAEGWGNQTLGNDNIRVFRWFCGGRCLDRVVYRKHHRRADAILYVVDQHNHDPYGLDKLELQSILTEEGVEKAVVVILLVNQTAIDEEETTSDVQDVKKGLEFIDIAKKHRTVVMEMVSERSEDLDRLVKCLVKEGVLCPEGPRGSIEAHKPTSKLAVTKFWKSLINTLRPKSQRKSL